MNFAPLEKPLFYVAGRYVSVLGLLAFAILFALGLITAKTLQSDAVRRFFARLIPGTLPQGEMKTRRWR